MGQNPMQKTRRVGFVDELRGLDILVMAAYHAMYDLVYIFGVKVPLFHEIFMPYLQPVIAIVFIILSGISCRYSRSNLKRGAKTFMLGMLLTAATMIFMPEQAIYFGILHFMGTAMMIFALAKPLLDLIPPILGIIASTTVFLFTYNLPDGWLGIGSIAVITLPQSLYEGYYLLPFGFGGIGSDYFPLLPWLFLFFSGAYLGVYFKNEAMPNWLYCTRCNILSKIGRHTIVIYLLHQPVIMAVLTAVFWVAGRHQ